MGNPTIVKASLSTLRSPTLWNIYLNLSCKHEQDGKWRPRKGAEWNSWMQNFYPASFAVFCCFVKNNRKSTKLLYNNGKITKQLSFPFFRNCYWKWAASLHRKCSTWAPDTSSNQIYWRQQRCGERQESPRNGFLVSSLSSLPSPAGSGVAGCASWLCYKLDNRAPQTPGNAVGFSPPLLWNTPSLMWRWRELCPWKREQLPEKFHPK